MLFKLLNYVKFLSDVTTYCISCLNKNWKTFFVCDESCVFFQFSFDRVSVSSDSGTSILIFAYFLPPFTQNPFATLFQNSK